MCQVHLEMKWHVTPVYFGDVILATVCVRWVSLHGESHQVVKPHVDWDQALRFQFDLRDSDYLWFHVSICLGETEHTQQTYLWVWTVWLCSGVSKALDSSTVGFSWGRVVQYSSAETELPSVDLNVTLSSYSAAQGAVKDTKTHLTQLTMQVLLINTRGVQRTDLYFRL